MGQFRDVNEPFHPRLEPHEGSELGDAAHRAPHRGADVVLLGSVLPGALHGVANREADLAGLAIDVLHRDAHLLADFENVGRGLHPIPRHLADMDEAINAIADVDEGAEVAHRSDDAIEEITDLERFEHLRAGIGGLALEHRTAREHEPPCGRDDLGHEGLDGLPDELLEVFHAPVADEARRHEATEPGDVALDAPLVRGGDFRSDDHSRFELRPVFDVDRPVGRRHVVEAILLVEAANRKLEYLTDLRIAPFEADELEGPLPPAAEIDEGRVGADRHHGAGDTGARIERGSRLRRCGRGKDRVDLDPFQGSLEILLEIILEVSAEIRDGDPLRWWNNVSECGAWGAIAAPLAPRTVSPLIASPPRATARIARGVTASRGSPGFDLGRTHHRSKGSRGSDACRNGFLAWRGVRNRSSRCRRLGRCRPNRRQRSVAEHRRSGRGDELMTWRQFRRANPRPLRADRNPPLFAPTFRVASGRSLGSRPLIRRRGWCMAQLVGGGRFRRRGGIGGHRRHSSEGKRPTKRRRPRKETPAEAAGTRRSQGGIECGKQDLNLHGITTTRPSTWRVCQFRHSRSGTNNRIDGSAATTPANPT